MNSVWNCLCYQFFLSVCLHYFNCVHTKYQNQVRKGLWFIFFYKSDIHAAGDDVNMVKFLVHSVQIVNI